MVKKKKEKATIPMIAAGKAVHSWTLEEFFLFLWNHVTRRTSQC
ncbi:MAG: hypothetical protein ACFFD2_29015 [Promethearchaeota archaeon]